MLPSDLQGLNVQNLENYETAKLKEFGDGYDTVAEVIGAAVRREIEWQPDSNATGYISGPTSLQGQGVEDRN